MPEKQVMLKSIELPSLVASEPAPRIPSRVYASRIQRALERMKDRGLTHLLVYGDREHSASIAYFVNVDPRFEEALLVLSADAVPTMLLGNECLSFADRAPVEVQTILFQSFSLMGQPRAGCTDPVAALHDAGLTGVSKPGLVGWKYYSGEGRACFDLPHYLVEAVAQICGRDSLACATDILLNPRDGLRNFNEPEQIAYFEWIATKASESVKNVVFHLTPGETEYEAMKRATFDGEPLSCHPMLTTGREEILGLSSPTDKRIERGDRFSCAIGLQGGLSCRAGFVAESEEDLAKNQRGYLEKVCFPYFSAIGLWYESIQCGAAAGQIYDRVEQELGAHGLGIALNPGHLLHLDEWTHTPFTKGSDDTLQSGMAIQCDNIPTVPRPYHGSNVEDGIAVADLALRQRIARDYPEAWGRIQTRREILTRQLGIRLSEDVLPFSNIPAVLPPFILRSHTVLAIG